MKIIPLHIHTMDNDINDIPWTLINNEDEIFIEDGDWKYRQDEEGWTKKSFFLWRDERALTGTREQEGAKSLRKAHIEVHLWKTYKRSSDSAWSQNICFPFRKNRSNPLQKSSQWDFSFRHTSPKAVTNEPFCYF